MGKHKNRFFLSILLGCMVFIVSIYGFSLLKQRRDIPEGISKNSIIKIDGDRIKGAPDLEFVLSRKKIGQLCVFDIRTLAGIVKKQGQITAYYSNVPYPIIYLVIGSICFITALFVFWLKPDDEKAILFYWAFVCLSCILILVGPFYTLNRNWLSFFPGLVFLICYPLSVALLYRFSLSFSERKSRWSIYVVFGTAILFSGGYIFVFLYSNQVHSMKVFHIYLYISNLFRLYVILIAVTSIALLIRSYRKAEYDEQCARIKWIIFGLIIGLGPLIFLYQFPRALGFSPILSEEIASGFVFFLPVCLGIAIVKYKLMNIELIINRSLVYSLVTVLIVGIYMLLVWTLSELLSGFFVHPQALISLIGAFGAALALHPARMRIQEFVDKSFFRISYDYRQSILLFNEKAPEFVRRRKLVEYFLQTINETMPLETVSIFIRSRQKTGLINSHEYSQGEPVLQKLPVELPQNRLLSRVQSVRTEEDIDFSCETKLLSLGVELVLPLSFRSPILSGCICMGKKRSGERYSHNDLKLLQLLAADMTNIWERIYLQGQVVKERAEKEKLDELIQQKSEFISTVSHELRTPMSSIHGLSELLLEGKIEEGKKKNEMLALMNRECSRLSRLLHNILDFGQIERQTKKYHFSEIDLRGIVEETNQIFENRLLSRGYELQIDLPGKPVVFRVDADSIKQALINLLDNAIKYSSDKRVICLRLINNSDQVEIHVIDHGIGIAEAEQKRIFQGFYRAKSGQQYNPAGIGLGLKIVKHIMDAHRGFIRIDSRPDKGSNFQMIFPKK